ncbi:MAG: ATP-dependent DNA helicase [Planctomycetota bacterium]
MTPTDRQRAAIETDGLALLVSASAGSGKTEVMARRCIRLLAQGSPRIRVDQLLVVTFTRAAAAELRARIGRMLREEAARATGETRGHLRLQAALLDTAEIGTFDAWCGRLVRDNFHAAEIDPAYAVLSPEQAGLLRERVLEELLESLYAGTVPLSGPMQEWVRRHVRPSDEFLREAIRATSAHFDHLIDAESWVARQREAARLDDDATATAARGILADAVRRECRFQLAELPAVIERMASEPGRAVVADYREALLSLERALAAPASIETAVGMLEGRLGLRKPRVEEPDKSTIQELRKRWLQGRFDAWSREVIAGILATAGEARRWVGLLVELAMRYRDALRAEKSRRAAYEFGDIQRAALRLLGRPGKSGVLEPTELALALRGRYEHILVDEYQDTSPVQAELVRLIARHEPGRGNRFLVGDLKQSIYGFREAEPRLFAELAEAMRGGRVEGRVLPLADNFRAHTGVLEPLNAWFERLFDSQLGGTRYDADARLVAMRAEIANPTLDGAPRVEVHIVDTRAEASGEKGEETGEASNGDEPRQGDGGEMPLERIEREALIAAGRLQALINGGARVPERGADGELRLRPLRWSDIVILLRSARGNAALLAAALRHEGIPCAAIGRESMLDCVEVGDLRTILTLLRCRRQDLALAAYLRSPLVGLTVGELMQIRAAAEHGDFFERLTAFQNSDGDRGLRMRIAAALGRIDRWREASRTRGLPELVAMILREGGFYSFAEALPGGQHRVAMLRAVERYARECGDAGLHDPAEFADHLDELELEGFSPAGGSAPDGDVVRIMTIHAAKGLEFPVVLLLGAGAEFSRRGRHGAVLLDESLGVGLSFFDYPDRRDVVSAAYPVLRQSAEARELEEEMRLLYVAATRARERLVIIGHGDGERYAAMKLRFEDGSAPSLLDRLTARSMLEWVLLAAAATGEKGVLVETHDGSLRPREIQTNRDADEPLPSLDDAELAWLDAAERLLTAEPDLRLARTAAAVSVSAAKRAADPSSWRAEATAPLALPAFAEQSGATDGRPLGTAVHRFFQLCDIRRFDSEGAVAAEIDRLRLSAALPAEEAGLIPVADVAWFGGTDLARAIVASAATLERELPFVAALPTADRRDFVLLRGKVDCLFDTPAGLVFVDYKTDRCRDDADFAARVAMYTRQIQLYARSISTIRGRPVASAHLVFLRHRCIHAADTSPSVLATVSAEAAGLAPVTNDE